MSAEDQKRIAGEAAAALVESGMIVGLGTGSTAAWFVKAVAARGLDIQGVPTSEATAELARSLGKAKNEFHKAQADSEVDKPAASTPTSLSTPVPESATPAAAIPEVAAPEVAAPETVTMTTSELERLVEERARQLAADPDHPAG